MSNTSRIKQGMCNTIRSSKNNPIIKMFTNALNPTNITSQHLYKLNEYLQEEKENIHLYSENGIYCIEDNNIFKMVPRDEPIKNIKNGDYIYSFDKSSFEKQRVMSQLPLNAVSIPVSKLYFCESKHADKSKITFVVEGVRNNKQHNDKNPYSNFIVTDVYFILKEEIDNYLIKKELNVFLSMLI